MTGLVLCRGSRRLLPDGTHDYGDKAVCRRCGQLVGVDGRVDDRRYISHHEPETP